MVGWRRRQIFAPSREKEIFIALVVSRERKKEAKKREGNYFVGSVAGSNRGIHPAWSVFADSASRTPGTRFLDCSPVNRKRGKSGYVYIFIYIYMCVCVWISFRSKAFALRARGTPMTKNWRTTKGRAVCRPLVSLYASQGNSSSSAEAGRAQKAGSIRLAPCIIYFYRRTRTRLFALAQTFVFVHT